MNFLLFQLISLSYVKKLSIVVPIYFNEKNLPETIPELLKLKEKLQDYELELIFVDDGSKDRSLEILLDFKKKYPDIIQVIKLTRNFGAPAAAQAGLSIATGDCIGKINADLQDPPELFIDMIKHWEKGIKAVFAVRKKRKDPLTSRILSNTFYSLLRRHAIPNYPKGGYDFFLVDKKVIKDFSKIQEKNTNINALIFWLGYEYVTIPYVRRERKKGTSKWTIGKKIKYFIDTFVGFSYFPVRLLSVIGIIVAFASFGYGIYIFYNWAVGNIQVAGWTTTIIVLLLTAGIQMIMIGVIGEYLWRTLDELRKRPRYVIEDTF